MALRGSLEDMDVFELVQFPHQGRKSGELILVGTEHEARLYYDKGKLVHARYMEVEGMPVLEEVLGWDEGDFEFRPNEEPPHTTIEMDLHRAVMHALKARDEKKAMQENEAEVPGPEPEIGQEDEAEKSPMKKVQAEESDGSAGAAQALLGEAAREAFQKAAAAEKVVLCAGLVDTGGNCLASIDRDPELGAGRENIGDFLRGIASSHPRPGFNRVIAEDEEGVVVMAALGGQTLLVVLADKQTSLGAASMSANKIAKAVANA